LGHWIENDSFKIKIFQLKMYYILLFLAAKCHNHAPLLSFFHQNTLGFILCNVVRLHHWQLILSLWHRELDAFQENCETLENDGVSFNFIEWLCAFERTWRRVTIAKETMCTRVFWGDHAHYSSRQNVQLHASKCAKMAMCIDLLSPC